MSLQHKWVDRLESGADDLLNADKMIALSQAISLKRIADALDDIAGRNPAKLGLAEAIAEAIGRHP